MDVIYELAGHDDRDEEVGDDGDDVQEIVNPETESFAFQSRFSIHNSKHERHDEEQNVHYSDRVKPSKAMVCLHVDDTPDGALPVEFHIAVLLLVDCESLQVLLLDQLVACEHVRYEHMIDILVFNQAIHLELNLVRLACVNSIFYSFKAAF